MNNPFNLYERNKHQIFKSYTGDIEYELEKGGKPAQLGEVRNWGGGKYQKTTQGWKKIGTGKDKEGGKVENKDESSVEEKNNKDEPKKESNIKKSFEVLGIKI